MLLKLFTVFVFVFFLLPSFPFSPLFFSLLVYSARLLPRLMKMYRRWSSLCSDGWASLPHYLHHYYSLAAYRSCLLKKSPSLTPSFLLNFLPSPTVHLPSSLLPSPSLLPLLRHFDNNCSTSIMTFLSCHSLLSRFFSSPPPSSRLHLHSPSSLSLADSPPVSLSLSFLVRPSVPFT